MEIDSVVLLLHGIGTSMSSRGESDPQRAIVGILTYEASNTAYLSYSYNYFNTCTGSVTINSLGS